MAAPANWIGTPEELGDFTSWGDDLLVPFSVTELKRPYVVWINERWFADRCNAPLDEVKREEIRDWLRGEFGFCVWEDTNRDAFGGKAKPAFADRYGSSGLGPHGGSGRAAVFGTFHVKGVGCTPLVAESTDWWHSHGGMWLEEAVREVIYSEIVAAEFPLGASQVVAVLDTGMRCTLPDGKQGKRKALLVRELDVRPAHMERACAFKVDETPPTRTRDVNRVVQVIDHFSRLFDPVVGLRTMFYKFGRQVGYGRAHRLFHGGYLTSNISVTGRLLDFGGFRSVPDWSRARSMDHIPGFGEELEILKIAARSISFYFSKYCRSGEYASANALSQEACRGIDETFAEECLQIWGGHFSEQKASEAVTHQMCRLFDRQQQTYVSYQQGACSANEWIYRELKLYLVSANPEAVSTPELKETLTLVESNSLTKAEAASRLMCGMRMLLPRDLLFREELQKAIYEQIGGEECNVPPEPAAVAEYVSSVVARSRRDWDTGYQRLGIVAQAMSEGVEVLLAIDEVGAEFVLHVRLDAKLGRSRDTSGRESQWNLYSLLDAEGRDFSRLLSSRQALWYVDASVLIAFCHRYCVGAQTLNAAKALLEDYANSRIREDAVPGTAYFRETEEIHNA